MSSRPIDPEQTLGRLVAERPALAESLERLRLDYCCGGDDTLARACARRGLDAATVAAMLEALGEPGPGSRFAAHDLRGAGIPELCDHIVAAHHERLRRELPRIGELMATVVRVHGSDHHELHDLGRLFARLRTELLEHLESEEATLFPAARALDDGAGDGESLGVLVRQHVADHGATGDALEALRELAGGYSPKRALCATHRTLLEALFDLELDLHQHVHEENNILFPRLTAAAGRTGKEHA